MSLATYIKNNDQENLKKYLSYLLDSWSFNIKNTKQTFDSAEELFQFFLLDMLTTLSYSFARDKALMHQVVANIKQIILDVELHTKDAKNENFIN